MFLQDPRGFTSKKTAFLPERYEPGFLYSGRRHFSEPSLVEYFNKLISTHLMIKSIERSYPYERRCRPMVL
jgi:hypothetical protein